MAWVIVFIMLSISTSIRKPASHWILEMLTHWAMRPRQNGRRFTVDNFKCIYLNEKFCILNEISLKYVPWGVIDNIAALVQCQAIIWSNVCVFYWCLYALLRLCQPQWFNTFRLEQNGHIFKHILLSPGSSSYSEALLIVLSFSGEKVFFLNSSCAQIRILQKHTNTMAAVALTPVATFTNMV